MKYIKLFEGYYNYYLSSDIFKFLSDISIKDLFAYEGLSKYDELIDKSLENDTWLSYISNKKADYELMFKYFVLLIFRDKFDYNILKLYTLDNPKHILSFLKLLDKYKKYIDLKTVFTISISYIENVLASYAFYNVLEDVIKITKNMNSIKAPLSIVEGEFYIFENFQNKENLISFYKLLFKLPTNKSTTISITNIFNKFISYRSDSHYMVKDIGMEIFKTNGNKNLEELIGKFFTDNIDVYNRVFENLPNNIKQLIALYQDDNKEIDYF